MWRRGAPVEAESKLPCHQESPVCSGAHNSSTHRSQCFSAWLTSCHFDGGYCTLGKPWATARHELGLLGARRARVSVWVSSSSPPTKVFGVHSCPLFALNSPCEGVACARPALSCTSRGAGFWNHMGRSSPSSYSLEGLTLSREPSSVCLLIIESVAVGL